MPYHKIVQLYLPASLLLAALVLGGSSSGGVWAQVALIVLAGAALVALAVFRKPMPPGRWRWLAMGIALLFALELVPLPPALWTMLPGRGMVADGFRLTGQPLPWLPLSLTPEATVAALVALLPGGVMTLSTAMAAPRGRLLAVWSLVVVALASVALGFLQVAQGEDSGLYLYALTNRGSAVALFANRNHLATLLLMALPAVAGVAAVSRHVLPFALMGLVLCCGVALVRSDAGLVLLGPDLVASVWIMGGRVPLAVRRGALVIGGIMAVAAAVASLLLGGGARDPSAAAWQHRPAIIATTLKAALQVTPFGAGAGSFRQIYPMFENASAATPEFVNHAHSDYAEVLLEHGVGGVVMVGAVLVWWLGRWRRLLAGGDRDPLALAGGVMLGVVLAHSLVDYPLRTQAIAVAAGLAAGLLAVPAPWRAGRRDA